MARKTTTPTPAPIATPEQIAVVAKRQAGEALTAAEEVIWQARMDALKAWRAENAPKPPTPRREPIARYRLTNTFVGDYVRQLCPACRDTEKRFGMKVTRLKNWKPDDTGCYNCLSK